MSPSSLIMTTNESTVIDYCKRLDINHCHNAAALPTNKLCSMSEQTAISSLYNCNESLPKASMVAKFFYESLPIIVCAIALLIMVLINRRYKIGAFKLRKSKRSKYETLELIIKQRKQKQDFLQRARDDYGYRGSKAGFIDDWRPIEFPSLQFPLDYDIDQVKTTRITTTHSPADDLEREVYLDYAGSGLPTKSQLLQIYKDSSNSILGNPHSNGPAASRTTQKIQMTKRRILKHLSACPGKYASLQLPKDFYHKSQKDRDDDDENHRHPGYELVFTSGATEAFRIIAERFPFSKSSIFLYVANSHNSVVGMRQLAIQKGAIFHCIRLQELEQMTTVSDWKGLETKLLKPTTTTNNDRSPPSRHQQQHLLVFPSECNFGGNRPNARSILRVAQKSGWHTMLDIAKDSATSPIHLNQLNPDFAGLSFYKWFGAPTGIGVLLVKRTAISVLQQQQQQQQYYYQGGGSVEIMLPNKDYMIAKSQLACLSNGTSHFSGIVNLIHGLEALDKVGGMSAIHKHTTCLAKELVLRLKSLRHANQRPVVRLYGAWKNVFRCCKQTKTTCGYSVGGPTVTLNVYRSDGTVVGYNEVSKLAALNKPPLQFRTGCFCNPGACQTALEMDDQQVIDNYEKLGHVCGDHIDLANGMPTGAVRISFGKDSLWEDMDAFVRFLEATFRDNVLENDNVIQNQTNNRNSGNDNNGKLTKVSVSEVYLFPIKSCAAFRVSKWPLCKSTGKLRYDREFAIVDTSGTALRMQTCSNLGRISTTIDLQEEIMRVSAPGFIDLVIDLSEDLYHGGDNAVRVCGNKCNGRVWGDAKVSEWFTNVLGIQCWLARYSSSSSSQRHGFSNEQPILLVSEHAVETLNKVLVDQGQVPCTAKRFRPNIVIRCDGSHDQNKNCHIEDEWQQIDLGNFRLSVQGGCPRCTMVDYDPTTGQKGKTLRALASYRRRNGHIVFGIFLRAMQQMDAAEASTNDVWIQEGDTLDCK